MRSKGPADRQSNCVRKMISEILRSVRQRPSVANVRFVSLNVANKPPQLIDTAFLNALHCLVEQRADKQNERLRESDAMTEEVLQSDVIVLDCPLYAYGVSLPFWVRLQNIMRPGKIYYVDQDVRYGKLHKKPVVVLEAGLKAFDFDAKVRVRKQLDGLCRKLGSLGVNKLKTVRYALFETRRSETPEEAVTVLGSLQIVVAKIRNHLL